MTFIWATRGRTWGFRFLSHGGFSDPLPAYLAAFDNHEANREFASRNASTLALRFEDPLGRRDRAGRVIPHDFVLFDNQARTVESVVAGRDLIWPLVEARYAELYDQDDPLSRQH